MKENNRNYLKEILKQNGKGEVEFLSDSDEFEFDCIQCGKCCRDRKDILLNPLDIYHLVQATKKDAKEVIEKYGSVYIGDSSHIPLIQLKYRTESDGSSVCFFLGRKDGKCFCRIHDYKPTVCRIYPLGKICLYSDEDGERRKDLYPQYFLQSISTDNCSGYEQAIKNHTSKNTVEWIGGRERKNLIDRYSVLFSKFLERYLEVYKQNRFGKLNRNTRELYRRIQFDLLYTRYDFTADEKTFLDRLEDNLLLILGLTQMAIENPKEFVGLVSGAEKRGGGKNEQE